MDKQLLHPNSSVLNYKLTKSASFSELSSKKKIVIEKQYQTQTHGNLLKQYSCEQIFDKKCNTNQIKVSHTYKTDNAEHENTWEKTIPACDSLKKPLWFSNTNNQSNFQSSFSNQTLTEKRDLNAKPIILPAKLVIDENKLNQLSIKEKCDLDDDKQVYLKNVNPNISPNYLFKKPLLRKNSDYGKMDKLQRTIPKIAHEENKLLKSEENIQDRLDTSQLKKRLRSLIAIEPKKKSNTYLCWSLMFFILLPVTIISLGLILNTVKNPNSFCTPQFNLKTITQELKKYIYDQDIAISELAKFFIEKENQTSFEVLVFVGGIGVGKSYTAEIIINNVKSTNKIFDVYPPLYNKEDEVYRALSVCRCNFIRLENLKTDDIVDAANFISNLRRQAEKFCILILALFNTEEVDHNLKRTIDHDRSISIIKDKFGRLDLQPNIMSFMTLSHAALVKCVKDAGDFNKVKLSNDDIEYVMRDLLTAESGCKGAYAKVQLVGKT
ncbi:uncharacterized protein LOC131672366 [Phymastichus coffea]|uniref:uncharacterized protein LOC131672366 n=1 Tax=Phymastichus coffea TaxID=108790 RepID=UPI00273C0328|nr:uncharacterized protein LOC131672366 [Phymastichus coffea]XP_058805530.1 uncharacterized protein LOC131672366 [Phymastichus coffea]